MAEANVKVLSLPGSSTILVIFDPERPYAIPRVGLNTQVWETIAIFE